VLRLQDGEYQALGGTKAAAPFMRRADDASIQVAAASAPAGSINRKPPPR